MKKKILTIIPSLFGGGAEKITADLSFNLSKLYDSKLLLYNFKENKYDYDGDLTEYNIKKGKNIFEKIIRQIIIYQKIYLYKKRIKPQATISHMLVANMLNVLSKKRDKTVCFLHGEWSVKTKNSVFFDSLIKKTYSKADMLISVSYYIKDMFNNKYNLNVPHKVIYIGVDIKKVLKLSNEKNDIKLPSKYIVYVAGFRPVKNHERLIYQLESYLKNSDMYLVLVGDGELVLKIKKLIVKLELFNKVILTGNLVNPYPVIKKAFLSLMVSSSESFSLVVVESMLLGIPVITTDCGGPTEIINQEKELVKNPPYISDFGVVIKNSEYWNQNSLIKQIEKLSKDKNLYDNISKMGRLRSKDFSLSKTEKELESVINELIKDDNAK